MNLQATAARIAQAHAGGKKMEQDILLALIEVQIAAQADVPQRLAIYLLEAFDAHHGAGELLLPQEEIAKTIGATRSYVSTLLTTWKSEGVLRGVGRKMFLEDRKALVRKTKT